MTLIKKAIFSFFISVFLCIIAAMLSFSGVLFLPSGMKGILLSILFFLTFLIAFFFFNITTKKIVYKNNKQILNKTVPNEGLKNKGLLAAASSVPIEFNIEAELEDLFLKPDRTTAVLTQFFSLNQENPELLADAEDIIFERNGIHYINCDFIVNINEKLEGKLITLVDSVVGK